MVETITPVVYGGRAGWARGVVLHVAGAVLAAAVFGAALGWLGGLLGAPFGWPGLVALALVALAYAATAAGVLRIPVPQLRRQVPDWWRTYFSPPVAAFLYGAGLGIGFLTFLATGALVVVTLAAALSGSAALGIVLLGAFGLTRGLSALAGGAVRTPEDGARLITRLSERSDAVRRVTVMALLALVAVGATLAISDAAAADAAGLAGATLAVVFAWAAVAKIAARRRWRAALATFALPARLERLARAGVPASEVVVPSLILLGLPTVAAGWGLLLIAGFAVASVRAAVRRGGTVACGCFGTRRERPLGFVLVRDAALAAIAVVVVAQGIDEPRWPGSLGPGDVLPAVLSLVGLAAAVLALRFTSMALYRETA